MKLHVLTGCIIAIHGLLRILFLDQYMDFVDQNYGDMFVSETILTVGSALLPFIEFFVGLLIVFKVSPKLSLLGALFLSVLTVGFIISANVYPWLIYHFIVINLLSLQLCRKFNTPISRFILKP